MPGGFSALTRELRNLGPGLLGLGVHALRFEFMNTGFGELALRATVFG